MTKKKIVPMRKFQPATFKVEETLLKSPPKSMPSNLEEEKEKFLRSGKPPKFEVKDRAKLDELASKAKNQIRFSLYGEAHRILEKVYDTYGNGEFFLEHAFGSRITKEDATPIVLNYIAENCLTESMKIHWCDNMACSAKLVWTGPMVNANRPDLRRYSLWINGSEENNYMRENGIRCLLDHEIGTHFFRSFNDGFQPWFSERERFGLRKLGAFEGHCTEEGLAAINTVLRGRVKFLWSAAMAYYTACKATEMTFKELFDHLGRYTSNREYRWKQAMRVKRGLADPNDLGGFGNDQCYFEGAVAILRNMEKIDFSLLMTGKLCHDELDRIKRVARKDVVHMPTFMRNMGAYRKTLRKMITLNQLNGLHVAWNPSDAYVKRLAERKNGKKGYKPKKVRVSSKISFLAKRLIENQSASAMRKYGRGNKIDGDYDDDDDDVDGDCGLGGGEGFPGGRTYINEHLRGKDPGDTIFEDSETVTAFSKLSQDITTRDSTLVEQIQKMHNIVQGHPWTCEEVSYKDGLLREAEDEFDEASDSEQQLVGSSSTNKRCRCKESEFRSQISLQEEGTVSTESRCCVADCDRTRPASTIPQTKCTSATLTEGRNGSAAGHGQVAPKKKDWNKDACCSNSNPLAFALHHKSVDLSSAKTKSSALKSSGDNNNRGLLHKRKASVKPVSRRLLFPSQAQLASRDIVESELQRRKPLEASGVKKRVSLNSPAGTRMACGSNPQEQRGEGTPSAPSFLPCSSKLSRPDSCDPESKSMTTKDMRDVSFSLYHPSPSSNIHIDVLDLANSQTIPSRTLDLRMMAQGYNQSATSISSAIDYESFLRVKHHVFQSNANKRTTVPMPQRMDSSGSDVMRERSHTTIIPSFQDSLSHYHPCSADVRRNIGEGSFFQPLVISSSKPLVQKGM